MASRTCALYVLMFMLADTTGETIEDIQGIYDTLFTPDIYNKQIRGQLDQTQVTNVTVKLSIKTIKKLNELDESIDVLGVLTMSWVDQRIQWDPAHYNNTRHVFKRMEDVWWPEMMLQNPASSTSYFGDPSRINVKYDYTGTARVFIAALYQALCPVDMTAFPIDTQTCTLIFIARGSQADTVQLVPNIEGGAAATIYTPSPAWRLVSSTARGEIQNQRSFLIYDLVIQRRPLFFILNILIPIISISVLNNFVFNIPVDSGERISFALTVLLSITVLMTLTADSMPQSSVRIPSITYFLFFNLSVSVLSCICNIVTIKLYHKHEEGSKPPRWLRRLIHGCRKIKHSFSRVCCKSKIKDDPYNVTSKKDCNDSGNVSNNPEKKQIVNDESTKECFDNSWKMIPCKHVLSDNGTVAGDHQTNASVGEANDHSVDELLAITWRDVSQWFDTICMFIAWAYTALSLFMLFYHIRNAE